MTLRVSIGVLMVCVLLAGALPASAQTLGLGGRTTFVRSEADPEGAEAVRFTGAVGRFRLSRLMALELAVDYQATRDEERGERVREYPVQASILLMPSVTRLAPYLLGGLGWYNQRIESLVEDDPDFDAEDASTSRMGAHAGLGAELRVTRRLTLHGDYRYTFIRFGEPDDDTPIAGGAIPLPGTRGLQERLNLHHEGSMWSFGVSLMF